MNDIIADFISQGVDFIVVAVILSSIVTMMSAVQQMNDKVNEQQAVHMEIAEYRAHSAFNGTEVRGPDIIAAIMKYRGTPSILVKIGANVLKWTPNETASGTYTVTNVSNQIKSGTYKATLQYGTNGEVVAYEFTWLRD